MPVRPTPGPSLARIAVRVTPDGARHIRAGHPWIFDESITSISRDGAAGDLAVVFDRDRRFMAIGLYDPASPIRIKVLHHGRPATVDLEWWAARVAGALERRQPLARGAGTDGYRCLNGENDGFPGLVADRYAATLVVKVYSPAWFAHLADVVLALVAATGVEDVVLRLGRSVPPLAEYGLVEGVALAGSVPPQPVLFHENGLLVEADVVRGQKTGYFLDQRDNRAVLRTVTAGARVLDVFACTGGFSLHAAAGGAASVCSVDTNRHALGAAQRNMGHNRDNRLVAACRHSVMEGDAFAVMDAMAGRGEVFDVVVIDPPSFAQRRANIPAALAAYSRLSRLGAALTRRGGMLMQSSCSSRVDEEQFHACVADAVGSAGRPFDVRLRSTHPIDHPVTFPEGAYLKTVFARL